jgi:hypothetical protein
MNKYIFKLYLCILYMIFYLSRKFFLKPAREYTLFLIITTMLWIIIILIINDTIQIFNRILLLAYMFCLFTVLFISEYINNEQNFLFFNFTIHSILFSFFLSTLFTEENRQINMQFYTLENHDIKNNTITEVKIKLNNDKVCCICLENVIDGYFLNCCNHHYHVDCLQNWIMRKTNCPLCRKNINKLYKIEFN